MRAVNLIPPDARRGGGGQLGRTGGVVYVVLGALAAALVLVVLYVSAGNTIANKQTELTRVQAQAAAAQAQAAQLASYTSFAQVAQARADTVRQLAASRFDWHRSLSQLSQVVPANTSLQGLTASVAPGAAGGGGIALRNAIPTPAFELTGCTATQDDVARLMSRLRLMSGVTRVTLQDSQKSDTGTGGSLGAGTGPQGCGANAAAFHLVVFFQPLPGATAATGATSASAAGTAPVTTSSPSTAAATASPSPSVAGAAATATPSGAAVAPVATGGGR